METSLPAMLFDQRHEFFDDCLHGQILLSPKDKTVPQCTIDLPDLVQTDVQCKTAILIADSTHGDSRCGLVFQLHHLALRRCRIGSKSHKQIATDPLLDG